MFDLIVRGGTVFDGTGSDGVRADVAVVAGEIVAIGPDLDGDAAEVIDATGHIVTPGFVDIHTHYDGQVTWDDALEPSAGHGVTTALMGNCGVGFAPVRPGREEWLIRLMEGVEDIPGAALADGISWGWESFADYLDVLDGRAWSFDVGTQVPHGALRAYVLGDGERGNDEATPEQIAELARHAAAAVEAGAFAFTTSRTMGHVSPEGIPVPGTHAARDELLAIARAVADAGGRNMEVAGAGITGTDPAEVVDGELAWIEAVAEQTGLTVSFITLQTTQDPSLWRKQMDKAAELRGRGLPVFPLIAGRPFGVLMGWDVRHPFEYRPSYRAIAHLPLAERFERLADPAVRAAILSETDVAPDVIDFSFLFGTFLRSTLGEAFALGNPPDYEPAADRRFDAMAEASGRTLTEIAYDALMASPDGQSMLLRSLFNYVDGDFSVLYDQFQDRDAVLGLDDAGAHCGSICDASIPTYTLSYWTRDRTRGPKLPLPEAIRRLTSQPAGLYGLDDRGVVTVGKRADLNVIDMDRLQVHAPFATHDLPAAGTRLLQTATGYRATVCHGVVTRRDDQDTGARPGRLLRRS